MTTDLPQGWRGRILALLLTVVVTTALWAGIVQPLMAWYSQRAEDLDHRRILAQHMAEVAETAPILRQDAKRLVSGLPASTAIDSPSDALAGATLQGLVQDFVARAGARLNSVEILPAMQRGEWRRIGLRLSVTAPLPALATLLQMIDRANVTILTDDMQLHAIPVRTASQPTVVDFAISLYVFRAQSAHRQQQ